MFDLFINQHIGSMLKEDQLRKKTAEDTARLMMAAARTAPKGRGRDTLFIALAHDEDIQKIATTMIQLAEKWETPFFARDAQNLLQSDALVLIGSRIEALKLKECGFCGFKNCDEKNLNPNIPCAYNNIDLGIAIGSAVTVAAQHHVDNRVMYSIGKTALYMGLAEPDVKVLLGIPLSIRSKNIYFDR